MKALKGNKRAMIAAASMVGMLVFCMIGFLIYSIATNSGASAKTVASPTAKKDGATQPASKETTVASKEKEATPTATQVISKEASSLVVPTETPKAKSEAKPTATSVIKNSSPQRVGGGVTVTKTVAGPPSQLFLNGDFEGGFSETGVALNWYSFQNDGVAAIFSPEMTPYIDSGQRGQRLTLVQATQPDRYAGLYQQVTVVPSQTYTLSLRGQIRSAIGDIKKSSYGYRMQYAIDDTAGTNWQALKPTAWLELPWDEQPLYTAEATLFNYTTHFTPTSNKLTLFIRAWNKWADRNEAQYSLDNFSLVGPKMVEIIVDTAPLSDTGTAFTPSEAKDSLVNKGLPVTGSNTSSLLSNTGRLWAGLLVVLFLSAGAIYRLKRER